jgi:hypothetical protein
LSGVTTSCTLIGTASETLPLIESPHLRVINIAVFVTYVIPSISVRYGTKLLHLFFFYADTVWNWFFAIYVVAKLVPTAHILGKKDK